MGGLASTAYRKIADGDDRNLKTRRPDYLIIKKIIPPISDSLIDTSQWPEQYLGKNIDIFNLSVKCI
jgi:hypothetical protein